MAHFDISNCKFIKTVDNPTQYYLDMIKKYIGKAFPNISQEANRIAYEDLVNKLRDKGKSLNDTSALPMIAYFAFDQVWYQACEKTSRTPNRPFALERDIDDTLVRTDTKSFYVQIDEYAKSAIYDASSLFTKPNEIGKYAVIDLDAISNLITNSIDNFYNRAERVNPELLKTPYPIKELHNSVRDALVTFKSELRHVISNVKTDKQTWTF